MLNLYRIKEEGIEDIETDKKPEELLNEKGYDFFECHTEENNIYTYGPIEENSDIKDLIKVIKKNKEIYLQRYYG